MVGKVFIFVGLILAGVGALVYYILGHSNSTIIVNGVRDNSAETKEMLQYSLGGGLAGLGLLFIVMGLRALSKTAKQRKQVMHILQTGIAVEGTVTFVDKNYGILVNKTPIYSFLEYTYQDASGKQHIRRVDTIPSDFVIRKNIQVGSKVAIKYASEDSSQSTILL